MNILRSLTKDNSVPNILCSPTHEGNEFCTAKTGFNYYAMQYEGSKPWREIFRPIPSNYHILNHIPPELDIDVVLSQTKFGQFQRLSVIAQQQQLPLISLEHTLCQPAWGFSIREQVKNMRGDLNVFISEYSVKDWGFSLDDPAVRVIKHGMDVDLFKPDINVDKKRQIISVVNDLVNRNYCCGWDIFRETVDGLPIKLVGDNPGLSEPSKSVDDLINSYRESSVFFNSSVMSPIPTVILEAMSVGLPIVSTSNCMIPEVVVHGETGFLSNDPKELRKYLELLLSDEKLAATMGENSRRRIVEHYNQDQFVTNWKNLIRSVL